MRCAEPPDMTGPDLTRRQRMIIEAIEDSMQRHGYAPTMREIGDAAGLAYPQSGEGIRPAVESGLMAAATILAAQGDYHRQQLLPYASRLVARFGATAAPGGVGPAFLRNFLAGILLGNKWFTRHVVLDRWFLHTHQAAIQTV